MTTHTIEGRPDDCRNRQCDEGKPYPKSGCMHCRTGGITGCPYENPERRTEMPSATYQTACGYVSDWEEQLIADEVYARGQAFLDQPSLKADTDAFQRGLPQPSFFLPPLQRVLHRQIGAAMKAMEDAASKKSDLMVKLAAQERALATAREELGAVLDAWPAEKVVPA